MSDKITVSRYELRWAVDNAIKFVEKSPSAPEFHNFVISGNGDNLKIIAASRPCYTEFNIPYKGDKVFFSVNAALFTQVVVKNVDETFDIYVYDDEIIFQKDKKKIKLKKMFPTFDMMNTSEAKLEQLQTDQLKKAVNMVKSCVASKKAVIQERFRHIMLDNEDGKLVAVATDGVRMAVYRTEIPFTSSVIVNAPCLNNAVNILGDIKQNGEIGLHGQSLQLRHDYCSFIFSPYEGEYANWKNIIDTNLKNVSGWIEIKTLDLKQCLDRLKILDAGMFTYTLKFTTAASTLFAKVEGEVQYEEMIKVKITGDVSPFIVSPNLLFDIVNPINDDIILLGVPKGGVGIVAIKPVTGNEFIAFCGTSIR